MISNSASSASGVGGKLEFAHFDRSQFLRVASWNVGHADKAAETKKARPRRDANLELYAPALAALDPDVIVLSEYVPAPRYHQQLRAEFVKLKYEWYAESNGSAGNRIFIASRVPMLQSNLPWTESRPDADAESNFAHVHFKNGINLVGLRAPKYAKPTALISLSKQISEYRVWLAAKLQLLEDEATIVIGDLNSDPSKLTDERSNIISLCRYISCNAGWFVTEPEGLCSHYVTSKTGGMIDVPASRRINHALVTKKLQIVGRPRYVYHIERERDALLLDPTLSAPNDDSIYYIFTGSDRSRRMSDHAVLVVDVVKTP